MYLNPALRTQILQEFHYTSFIGSHQMGYWDVEWGKMGSNRCGKQIIVTVKKISSCKQ